MNLYLLTNELGDWYVIAEDPTSAQRDLESRLDLEDYGFRKKRKVTQIELLAEELTSGLNSKWFFSSENTLLLPEKETKWNTSALQ